MERTLFTLTALHQLHLLVVLRSRLCVAWLGARGSAPQTLGKAVLCPYKAAIHPLPSSSPAPFLCLSQT